MAVLSGATASGRQFYSGLLANSWTVLYTAPAQNANVTTPSATAYIKEIAVTNFSASPATVTIGISSSTTAGSGVTYIMYNVSINPNDTKILSGLNTMVPAGWTIQSDAGASTALHAIISGVEIQ